jgi:hypothetical protein
MLSPDIPSLTCSNNRDHIAGLHRHEENAEPDEQDVYFARLGSEGVVGLDLLRIGEIPIS